MNEKKGPHSLCWIMTTLSALCIFEGPSAQATGLAEWVLKTWQILWGCHFPIQQKLFKSQRHFTLHNLLKLHVSSSRILILLPSIFILQESLLTLVVKEESLPCSFIHGFHILRNVHQVWLLHVGPFFTCM
jgi:hypothetical protein